MATFNTPPRRIYIDNMGTPDNVPLNIEPDDTPVRIYSRIIPVAPNKSGKRKAWEIDEEEDNGKKRVNYGGKIDLNSLFLPIKLFTPMEI
jgi:hypothetical protein